MDSDTDSDLETGHTPPQWDAADFTQAFTQASSIQPDGSRFSALEQAVNYLMSMDSLASDDCHRHDDIQAASTTIARTLDSMRAYRPTADEEWRELLQSFSIIVSIDFLTKLFELRRRFHVVAASELASSKAVTILVCWVDVILAKIGEAATAIAGGRCSDLSPCPDMFDSLARQREGDALRAAAQLPHAWEKIPMLLLSESASPAAARLALCLAFAAYIVWSQLTGMDSTSIGIKLSHIPDLLRIHTLRYPTDNSNTSDSGEVAQPLHETSRLRVNHAMLVSLVSIIILRNSDQRPSLGLRPWTRTLLLQLMQSVIHPGRGAVEVRDLSPCATLDPAQNILLRWGQSVQLCWATFDDPRCADVESITYLTATYLYNMRDADAFTWRQELSSTLAESPVAASIYILQQLHHCVSLLMLSRLDCESGPWSDILYKACAAVAILSNPSHVWHVPITVEMARCLCLTFVLCSGTSVGLSIREVIIDALSRVTVEVLQKAIHDLVEDDRMQFSARFDEAIATTRRALVITGTLNVSTAIVILDFVAVIWKNDAYLSCHRGTVSSFLSTVVDALSEDPEPSPSLICSLMTVLSIYEFTKLWDDEKVLEVALSSFRRTPLSASVISNYIIATQENDNICASVWAEAWDHVLDVLLLTLRNSYDGEKSLLALLVAPSLCHALCSLIYHSERNLAQWIIQSPWTCHLRQELRALLETSDEELSHGSVILKERIFVPAQVLLGKTKGKFNETDKSAISDLPRLSAQLFCHTSELGQHLILVPK